MVLRAERQGRGNLDVGVLDLGSGVREKQLPTAMEMKGQRDLVCPFWRNLDGFYCGMGSSFNLLKVMGVMA